MKLCKVSYESGEQVGRREYQISDKISTSFVKQGPVQVRTIFSRAKMTALGAVQIALDDLDFSQSRQISFKVRQRLVRVFENLSKLGAAEIHLPCTVDEVKLNQILAHLALSASQLSATLKKGQKNLPLLSGVRLSCLYGHYPTAAASRTDGTAVVVHLFSAERELSKFSENSSES